MASENERRLRRADAKAAKERVVWYAQHPGETRGLATGLRDVDYFTGGLIQGEVTLAAARPSVGKTSLVMSIADRVLHRLDEAKREVLVFVSQEMLMDALMWRWGSIRSGVSGKAIERGEYLKHGIPHPLDKSEYRSFYDAMQYVEDCPGLFVLDGGITTSALRRELTNLANDGYTIKAVIDDYLALHQDAGDNEPQRITGIARSLKALAGEFNTPVLCVAQLNRSVERREGSKIPMLADLRDGGEADADNVWFVHRDDYYEPGENEKPVVKAGIYVAKARNGPVGFVPLKFTKYTTRFDDWDSDGKGAAHV